MADLPIVVIGAGSTGSSTAYHLAKAGQRVVLLEKGQVGGGMTSLSSAIVRTQYSNEAVARMALYSLRTISNFGEVGESGFVRTGLMLLAPSDFQGGIRENVKMLNSIGARNEILERSEASRLFPEMDYSDCDFIVYEPESGYADSVGIANAYARAAASLGAQVLVGKEATRMVFEDSSLVAVSLSDGSRISCSKVMLCTNVWTNKLLSNSGSELSRESFPLWAAAHPLIVLRRPPDYHGIRPVILDAIPKTYYKPEGQYLLFVGSVDPAVDARSVDPDNYSKEVSFEFVTHFSEAVSRRIPKMSQATLHSTYVGMYDMSPDQHPIIDELSDLGLPGVFCCVGLSGHGFKLCPALGLMNAEMILERKLSEQDFDRSLFSLSRFKRGELLRSKYEGLATVA